MHTWKCTTAETYEEKLNVLLPAAQRHNGFLLGCPDDHDGPHGAPRFTCYLEVASTHGPIYLVSEQPMTRSEFRSLGIARRPGA